jgi:hypothetical protein
VLRRDYSKAFTPNTCPRCDTQLKAWASLTEDEQTLAKSLPASADFPLNIRKKHRFCTRCWYEDDARNAHLA